MKYTETVRVQMNIPRGASLSLSQPFGLYKYSAERSTAKAENISILLEQCNTPCRLRL